MSKYKPTQTESQVFIYNPQNWSPTDSLPSDLHEYQDAARYFLHRIFMGRIIDRSHKDSLVPLKAQYMREVITDPDIYLAVKDSLLKSGTIVTDNQFVVGSKCKAFGLGNKLKDQKHVRTLITDKFIAKRILAVRKKADDLPLPDVYSYLKSWLNKVEIDSEAAYDHVVFNNQFFEYHDGRHETSIHMVETKDWFAKVCSQGRFHSNISCLESSLRQFLSFKGKRLVNLDIRNSQPLIFGSLVLNSLQNNGFLESVHSFIAKNQTNKINFQEKTHNKINFQEKTHNKNKFQEKNSNKINSKISQEFKNSLLQEFKNSFLNSSSLSSSFPSSYSPPTPSLYDVKNYPLEDNQITQSEDLKKYINLCEEGQFYNFLMKELNLSEDESLRKQFKQSFFGQTFFCESKFEGKETQIFKKLFPTVYEVLRQLKSRDYRTPALALQRAEADLIINRAVRRLMIEFPSIPILTVHDSILTIEEHAETVKAIMLEAFSCVGLIPTIKVNPA